MELEKIRKKVINHPHNQILIEWENEIIQSFYKDSNLILDSELFEIMEVKTKNDVLKIIDYLINKLRKEWEKWQ